MLHHECLFPPGMNGPHPLPGDRPGSRGGSVRYVIHFDICFLLKNGILPAPVACGRELVACLQGPGVDSRLS